MLAKAISSQRSHGQASLNLPIWRRSLTIRGRELVHGLFGSKDQLLVISRKPKRKPLVKILVPVTVDKPLRNDERIVNHYLAVTSTSLVLATAGTLFFAPLKLLCIPGLIYTAIPVWKDAYEALVKERRFRMACLDAVVLPTSLLTGYFVASSSALMLYFLARKFLLKTQEQSKSRLVNIMGEQPRSVCVLSKEGIEIEIAFEDLQAGDRLVMDAGQMIPIDGTIVDGHALIDERMLTGEAQPVEKYHGEAVMASTIVLQGRIIIEVETTGDETIAAQIGQILQQTADFKNSVQLNAEVFGDRVAFPLLALSGLAYGVIGPAGALAVMCAPVVNTIRVASPLSILNFLQQAMDQGILIKDGRSLELLNTVDTIVFDKTGTLTEDQPIVGAIHSCTSISENELLRMAAAAEQKQTHPIANAILTACRQRELPLPSIKQAKYELGYGLTVTIDKQSVCIGSQRFMESVAVPIPEKIQLAQLECSERGDSLVYVAIDGVLAGAIELHPSVRSEVSEIVDELRKRGFTTYIISGDREETTKKLAQDLHIDHYFAETLPEDKANLIAQLQNDGKKVCFVGDGINDSLALKKANVPVSISGATAIATDTAQIILMDGNLRQLIPLLDLAQRLDVNMKRNIMAAAIPSALCIGGAFFLHLGLYGAIGLYNLSLIIGVINAISPTLQNKESRETN